MKKLFSGPLPKVILVIVVILCLAALLDEVRYANKPFFSHERLVQFLSEESITKSDQILYKDTRISVTPELSEILDAQDWTRARRVKQQEETPILAIEYTDFRFIYIYGSYACLVDRDALSVADKIYYTFPGDISEELVAYLERCEVIQTP